MTITPLNFSICYYLNTYDIMDINEAKELKALLRKMVKKNIINLNLVINYTVVNTPNVEIYNGRKEVYHG